jgi:Flp pilus assembly protein TadG
MSPRSTGRQGFGADTGGAIAVMTALLLPVLIGIAAYAVDASLLLYRQERLQVAADIGARAGAEMLLRGESDARAIAFAETMVTANAGAPAGTLPTVTVTLPESGQLTVDASLPVPRFFSQLFGDGDVTVRAGSVAVYEMTSESPVCVHLDSTGNKALNIERDGRLSLVNCALDIAASTPNSAEVKNRANLAAACVTAAGRIIGGGTVVSDCPGVQENTAVAAPPPVPQAPRLEAACTDWESDEGGKGKGKKGRDDDDDDDAPASLTPGAPFQFGMPTICLSEMTVSRDTTGGPGIYFIEDKLDIEDGATLTLGPGAVIVLLGRAEIDMDDDARLVITAPDKGPLAGMTIVPGRDRDDADRRSHELGILDIEGRIALPLEEIEITGRGGAARCTTIHAGSLTLDEDAALDITCPAVDGSGGSVSITPSP